MALQIHVLDYGDIELETSFLVLGHECGRTRRVPVYGFLITGGGTPCWSIRATATMRSWKA